MQKRKVKRYLGFTETSHAYESLVVINGHNSRNNRTSNSNLATVVDEFEENISVVE